MASPSTHQVSLACGAGGAWVDISADVRTESPIMGSWGRVSDFDDTRPGLATLDLDNGTGKYTPKNPASSLAIPIRRGMGVAHYVDGLKRSGTVRSVVPYFIGDYASAGSSRVRVTFDDMLGDAARHTFVGGLAAAMVQSATPYLWWKLDDAAGSVGASETSGLSQPPMVHSSGTQFTFGANGIRGVLDSQLEFSDLAAVNFPTLGIPDLPIGTSLQTIPYASLTSLGWWSVWVTGLQTPSGMGDVKPSIIWSQRIPGVSFGFSFGLLANGTNDALNVGYRTLSGTTVKGASVNLGEPHFLAANVTQATVAGTTSVYVTVYADGVLVGGPTLMGSYVGAAMTRSQATPSSVSLSTTGGRYSNFALSELMPQEQIVGAATTEAAALTALAAMVPEVTLNAPPAGLSGVPIIVRDLGNQDALKALNAVMRTEQGYIYTETTGIITAPVQKIITRERVRSATVDAAHTFSITEIDNAPEFVTDIENMVWQAAAQGPLTSGFATDASLIPEVGTASDSTQVLLRDGADLIAWAQDRIIRGSVDGVRVPKFTVDALSINRWADIVAMRPGDRVRVSDLPSQLAVSYIDGWLVGGGYSLDFPERMLFTFNLQPALDPTGKYNTALNRYSAGGMLSLSAGINAVVTSMSVKTSSAITRFTTDPTKLPQDIEVGGPGGEQMSVTAVSAATPQVFTVVRGVNGTAAAVWPADADVDIAKPVQYAF